MNASKIFTLGFASSHKKLGKGRFHLDETATESDKDFLNEEIKNMFKANGDEISWEQVETILEKRGFLYGILWERNMSTNTPYQDQTLRA